MSFIRIVTPPAWAAKPAKNNNIISATATGGDARNPEKGGENPNPLHRCYTAPGLAGILLAAALAFDPHVLLLSWSAERQERVPATSAATCRAAIDAIGAGRWLADDPPVAVRCERGSAFAPGWDCIEGFNCGARR